MDIYAIKSTMTRISTHDASIDNRATGRFFQSWDNESKGCRIRSTVLDDPFIQMLFEV